MNNLVPAKHFSPWSLGAPLYMPAHRPDLLEIANGEKLPQLRTVIFCTEDAILQKDVFSSLRYLGVCLQGFRPHGNPYRFIRVRNPQILARLLDLPCIEKIDGFILPKFNLAVFDDYINLLQGTDFQIMPTLETREVFDTSALRELRQALLSSAIRQQIIMLRIGGNDLMNLLGLRRSKQLTLYATPLGRVISELVTCFKPYGFNLSAPVFEYLDDNAILQQEIDLDLAHGLVGKTAIHPSQIGVIEAAYRVKAEELDMAVKLMKGDTPAVFKMHGAMCEVATHLQWAQGIIEREQFYGVQETMTHAYSYQASSF